MIGNVISHTVATRLHGLPIYDAFLQQDGVPMPGHHAQRDLRAMTVEHAMRTAIGDVIARPEAATARVVPVVDAVEKLIGIVGRRELARAGLSQTLTAQFACREVVTLFPDQSLDLALLKLGRHGVRQAPVVTRAVPDRVVGMLSLEDISAAVGRTQS